MSANYSHLSERLNSFKSQLVSVRSTKGSRTTKTVEYTWPHPPNFGANPETLAAAGFYYAPEGESPDRVMCFCCGRGLANWEKGDSPFEEHYTRDEDNCAWAAARCSLEKDRVKRGKSFTWNFASPSRFPTDPSRYQARLNTFQGWPYDKTKGHRCNSRALASAGFIFTPEPDEYKDMVKCFYCLRELSGWSREDDPMEEHRRNQGATCPFVKAFDEQAGGDAEEEELLKPKRRTTRTVSSSQKPSSSFLASSSGQKSSLNASLSKSVRRNTRTASSALSKDLDAESVAETDVAEEAEDPRPRRTAKKKKGTASRIASTAPSEEESSPEAVAPTTTSKGKKKTAPPRTEPEPHSDGDEPLMKPKTKPTRTKGKAKTAPSIQLASASVSEAEDVDIPPVASSSRKTKRLRPQSTVPVEDSDDDMDLLGSSKSQAGAESEDERPRRVTRAAGGSQAPSRASSRQPPAPQGKTRTRTKGRTTVTAASAIESGAETQSVDEDTEEAIDDQPPPRPTRNPARVPKQTSRKTPQNSKKAKGRATITAASANESQGDLSTVEIVDDGTASMSSGSERPSTAAVKAAKKTERQKAVSPSEGPEEDQSTDENEPAPPKTAGISRGSKTKATSKALSKSVRGARKKAASASTSAAEAVATSDTDTSHYEGITAMEVDMDADADVGEPTPQPFKINNKSSSSTSTVPPIPAPNFPTQPILTEKPRTNGWHELASSSSDSRSSSLLRLNQPVQPGGSTMRRISAHIASRGLDSSDSRERVIVPIRKSRARSSGPDTHASTLAQQEAEVKTEDDEIQEIPPPPSRVHQNLADPNVPHERVVNGHTCATSVVEPIDMAIREDKPTPQPSAETHQPYKDGQKAVERAEEAESTSSSIATGDLPLEKAISQPSGEPSRPPVTATGPPARSDALDVLAPFLGALPQSGLTTDQLEMSIQEFIASETQRAYDAMKRDGEKLKHDFIEEGKRKRAAIAEYLTRASAAF